MPLSISQKSNTCPPGRTEPLAPARLPVALLSGMRAVMAFSIALAPPMPPRPNAYMAAAAMADPMVAAIPQVFSDGSRWLKLLLGLLLATPCVSAVISVGGVPKLCRIACGRSRTPTTGAGIGAVRPALAFEVALANSFS